MESTNSTGENLGASEVLAGLRFQYEVLSSNHSCQAKGKDRTWCGRSTPRLENWGPYLAQNGSKTFKLVSINCQECTLLKLQQNLSEATTKAQRIPFRLQDSETPSESITYRGFSVFDLGPLQTSGYRRPTGSKAIFGITENGFGLWFTDDTEKFDSEEVQDNLKTNRPLTVSITKSVDGQHEWLWDVTPPRTVVKATDQPHNWYLFSHASGIDRKQKSDAELSDSDRTLQGEGHLGYTLSVIPREGENGYQGELKIAPKRAPEEARPSRTIGRLEDQSNMTDDQDDVDRMDDHEEDGEGPSHRVYWDPVYDAASQSAGNER